jgi:hypothetical protein
MATTRRRFTGGLLGFILGGAFGTSREVKAKPEIIGMDLAAEGADSTVRTGLPKATWRKLNDSTGNLESFDEIDDLDDLDESCDCDLCTGAITFEEALAEKSEQAMRAATPERFRGLSDFYNPIIDDLPFKKGKL